MSVYAVYDPSVNLTVIRNGQRKVTFFRSLRRGDRIQYNGVEIVVGSRPFYNKNDPEYTGWMFYSEDMEDFYPENFGAKKLRPGRLSHLDDGYETDFDFGFDDDDDEIDADANDDGYDYLDGSEDDDGCDGDFSEW